MTAQWNEYKILKESAGCYLLKCTIFNCEEDLGDGTMCSYLGQEIWVAGYFVRHMPCYKI